MICLVHCNAWVQCGDPDTHSYQQWGRRSLRWALGEIRSLSWKEQGPSVVEPEVAPAPACVPMDVTAPKARPWAGRRHHLPHPSSFTAVTWDRNCPGLPAVPEASLQKPLPFPLGTLSCQLFTRRSQNQDPSSAECQGHTHSCVLASLSLFQPSPLKGWDAAVLSLFPFFLCSILSIRLWLRKASSHNSHTGFTEMQLR